MKRGKRRVALRKAAKATWKWNSSELAAGPALRCLIAIVLTLAAGFATGQHAAGMVASAGALTAGFGSFERLRGSRSAPMLLASVGTALSAFAGSMIGHSDPGFVAVAAVWGFACGLLTALSTGAWWIGLQCVIFALTASNFPTGLHEALLRAFLVFGGGLLQAAIVMAFWRFESAKANEAPTQNAQRSVGLVQTVTSALRTMREHIHPRSEVGKEALRLAITLAMAAAIARLLHLTNGYWVPMTALLVLKSDFHQTFTRGLARIGGTLVGAGVATLIAATLRPGPAVLMILVVLFAWLCFTLLRVNYALYAVCITSYIVFQLAIAGLPEMHVIAARALDTMIGGSLAVLAHAPWPAQRRRAKHRIMAKS
ncbi:MAG: hypothetical protein JWQ02_4551 [Capsulimonas sp.]|nr:hypothetical protein [Capsulimonas sp.]